MGAVRRSSADAHCSHFQRTVIEAERVMWLMLKQIKEKLGA